MKKMGGKGNDNGDEWRRLKISKEGQHSHINTIDNNAGLHVTIQLA